MGRRGNKRNAELKLALRTLDIMNWSLRALNAILFPYTSRTIENLRTKAGKILILRTGNIGDTACALPGLIAIRKSFPKCHITLLTSPGPKGLPEAGEVLGGLRLVDKIITFYIHDVKNKYFMRQLIKNLRSYHYDLFIRMGQDGVSYFRTLRDLCFARLLDVKGAFGFEITNYFPFFDKRRLKDYVPQNQVERILSSLADKKIIGNNFEVCLPESDIAFAEEFLQKSGVNEGDLLIGIHMGTKVQANRWPIENFIGLCNLISTNYPNSFFFFTGSGKEYEIIKNTLNYINGRKAIVAGKASILQTAAIVKKCNLFITVDSGIMHLAALLNVPIIAIFSARQYPNMWYPWGNNHVIFRKKTPCELCFLTECSHRTCLKAITVEEVFRAVQRLLVGGGALNLIRDGKEPV